MVKFNIPAISDRTIRRDIASSGVTIGLNIQVLYTHYVRWGGGHVPPSFVWTSVLAEAAPCDRGAKWWIKADADADGYDVVGGLCEC